MERVVKIRIYPNRTQKKLIHRILGACRFVYNEMIAYNKYMYYEKGSHEFVNYYEFSKLINKWKTDPLNDHFSWLTEIPATKALKDSLKQCNQAYLRAFKKVKDGKYESPRFKSKRKSIRHESYYFIKDAIHFNTFNPHMIKLPMLKYVRVKSKKGLPDEESLVSGRVIREYDKYYAMFIYHTKPKKQIPEVEGVGIDLGIKDYASIAFPDLCIDDAHQPLKVNHFIHDKRYQKCKEKIIKLQRIISIKAEMNYGILLNKYLDSHHGEEPSEAYKNIMKGESYHTTQIRKLQKKVQRLHEKYRNIRKDFICKLVYGIVAKLKPEYITIEDLKVSNMQKHKISKDMNKYISESGWYLFRTRLTNKCEEYSVELRIADKFFASSKTCCCCGWKNKHLKLSDREFICPECGMYVDRDFNAAINLANTKNYHAA